MTDGQYLFVIFGIETAAIAASWAVWRHIQWCRYARREMHTRRPR